jgi:hypothetical protein
MRSQLFVIELKSLLIDPKFLTIEPDDVLSSRDEEIYVFATQRNSFLGIGKTGLLTHASFGSRDVAALCVASAEKSERSLLTGIDRQTLKIPGGDATAADLEIVALSEGSPHVVLIGLGQYLSGGYGAVSLQLQPDAGHAVRYELVPLSSVAKLAAWNGRWVHHSSRTLLEFHNLERLCLSTSQDRPNGSQGLIDFGRWPPSMTQDGMTTRIATSADAGGGGGEDRVADDVSFFNPLIYYCVYGNYQYLEALALSLESLDRHGHFDGTIAIITDFSEAAVRRHVPHRFQASLLIMPMPKGPAWLGRYCPDFSAFSAFQPILYLDCDVVCARPISELLIDLLLTDKICIATEWREYADMPNRPEEWQPSGHWFGKFLFDSVGYKGTASFGNSGIIGMSSIDRCRDVFALMSELMSTPGATLGLGDQPFLNFILHMMQRGDFSLLDEYVQINRLSSDYSPERPHTLIHVLNALTRDDKTSELRLTLSHMGLQRNYYR